MQFSQEGICVGVLFNKVAGPQNWNFITKSLQHNRFPVKFAKPLGTPLFIEHLQCLLLAVSGFQATTLLKKRLQERCFPVNFAFFFKKKRLFFLFQIYTQEK